MANCTGRIQDGIYNCFGHRDECMCYNCIYNSESEAEEKQDRFCSHCEKVNELYQFLMGKSLPDGVECKMPKLKPQMAFTVIWFLQEHLHILPDTIERCRNCGELFDSDSEGCYIDDGHVNEETGKPIAKKYWGDWCDGCSHIPYDATA